MADEVTFDEAQQELVNKLVGEARTSAREKAKVEQDALTLKAKGEAERAALVEKEEWQKLAQQHEGRVKELEPLEAQVKAYGELIAGMLKNRLKDLPKEFKKMYDTIPGEPTDLEKLDWLNTNEELFEVEPRVGTPAKGKKRKLTDKGREGHRPIRL